MELKEFVSETLKQIIIGIQSAQREFDNADAKINPKGIAPGQGNSLFAGRTAEQLVQLIEFDISLTAIEDNEHRVGIGVFFSSVGIGGQSKTGLENSSVNKVKFSIPVKFPCQ